MEVAPKWRLSGCIGNQSMENTSRLTPPLVVTKQAYWIFEVIENEIYTRKQTIFEPQKKQERRERERYREYNVIISLFLGD